MNPAGHRVQPRRADPGLRKQSWLGRFVTTYGWRAYALPVLAVVYIVVLYQTVTGTTAPVGEESEIAGPPTIGSAGTAIVGARRG